MDETIKKLALKSKEIASNPVYKYCHMDEETFHDKRVVWAIENLREKKLYFNQFDKFKDFQELKIGFRLRDGVLFFLSKICDINASEIEATISETDIDIIKEICSQDAIFESMDFKTFRKILELPSIGTLVKSSLASSNMFQKGEHLDFMQILSNIDNRKEIYKNEMAFDSEEFKIQSFHDWLNHQVLIESDKIDLNRVDTKEIEKVIESIKNLIRDKWLCTCLCQSYDNHNNWQNYSRGRNGFVIELKFEKEDDEFFENHTFLKVKYSKEPIFLDLNVLASLEKNAIESKAGSDFVKYIEKIIKTKNYQLRNEEEIRIVTGKEYMEKNGFLLDVSKQISKVYIFKDNKSEHLNELVKVCADSNIEIVWLDDSIDSFKPKIE